MNEPEAMRVKSYSHLVAFTRIYSDESSFAGEMSLGYRELPRVTVGYRSVTDGLPMGYHKGPVDRGNVVLAPTGPDDPR